MKRRRCLRSWRAMEVVLDGEMMEAEKEINCKVDREVEEMLEVVCVLMDRGVGLLIKLVLDMEVVSRWTKRWQWC